MTRYSQYIKRLNIISDFLLLNGCFAWIFYNHFGSFQPPFALMAMYINVTWFVITSILKAYDISRTSGFYRVLRTMLSVLVVHLLVVFTISVIEDPQRFNRDLLFQFYPWLTAVIILYKMFLHFAIKYARIHGLNYRNIVIVTQDDNPMQVQSYISDHPEYGYRILKVINVNDPEHRNFHEDLKTFCIENNIHEIFYSISLVNYDTLSSLMNFAEENLINFRLVADFKWVTFRDLEIEKVGGVPVMKVHTTPLDDWDKQLVKRTFDIVFSLVVITGLLSWLLPVLAVMIKLDSKGPVFFRQRRTGRDNRWFWCYKLRTMHVNGESDTRQATANDERITPFGHFLRNSSLDELPQFFNVLIGDMSVVGPRPHMLQHTRDFSVEIDKFMARHKIKPGITGLAQAKGYRGETTDPEKKKNRIKLDLYYVNNWTFFFDLRIILHTIVGLWKQPY